MKKLIIGIGLVAFVGLLATPNVASAQETKANTEVKADADKATVKKSCTAAEKAECMKKCTEAEKAACAKAKTAEASTDGVAPVKVSDAAGSTGAVPACCAKSKTASSCMKGKASTTEAKASDAAAPETTTKVVKVNEVVKPAVSTTKQ